MKKILIVTLFVLALSPIGAFADETVDAAFPATRTCNGGSAIAPTTPPLGLACPVSGGPDCKDGEACRCTAVKNAAGGWESENVCVKR